MTDSDKDPEYVTFTDGARLLVREGLARSMTPQGLRYAARKRDDWPFGDEPRQKPYLVAGQTRMMRTSVLLAYYRKKPSTGRGPAKKPPGGGDGS
jgi:hypothetical protein